jgi:acyl-CoA synthetase (AMP-forming)/AMP-acid ligase II
MNPTQTLHAAHAHYPNAIATICGERQQNWSELRDRVERLAGAIKSLGVEAGDRVAILALNSDRYLEYYYAVWWAGAVVVPLNVRWSATENAYSLKDSGTTVLFIDGSFLPMLEDIRAGASALREVVFCGDETTPEGLLDYETLVCDSAPIADAERAAGELAGIYYTGGTTGFPKGVMVSHQALWFNAFVAAHHMEMTPGCSYLHAAPMFHMADHCGSFGVSMIGATHVFVPSFEAGLVMDTVRRHGVTHSLLVPTMINMLLQHEKCTPENMQSLECIVYGASPMPEGVLREAMGRFPDTRMIQAYGQTELAPLVTCLPAKYHVLEGPNSGKLRAAGRPVIGVELKILDEDKQPVAAGEVGEIVVRSPGAMLGYWQLPEQTAATLIDGWIYTGDGAYMDEDGFVFIVDRLKDMIVTGGENVFSAEVESVVSTHPAVSAVAVIGIPSEKWGEAVHAIVVLKDGESVTEQEIIDHVKPQIANYKCPRSVSFRSEPLPLSGAGKVLKRELREPYWEGTDRGVG